MASASGVNVELFKIFAVAVANGLVGLSGGLIAQYQGFADIGMGIGTVVIGLASVIIGESVLKSRNIAVKILSAIVGAVVFRLMIACALFIGFNPNDLKLLTALFVLFTLFITKYLNDNKKSSTSESKSGRQVRKYAPVLIGVVLIGVVGAFVYSTFFSKPAKTFKIGVLQVADNGLLNITRESFLVEIKKLGYTEENCELLVENANGELPNVNAILDKFLMNKVDVIVAISTPVTQAAIKKVTKIPVVFATVANPFILKAGESDSVHLPNVTGVYGWVPMEKVLEYTRQIIPGKLKLGVMWDPAQANSVFNVEQLKKAVTNYNDIEFEGVHIASSNEVYQAAQSLVAKGINMFLLPPDNIVYSAFESIVKAADTRNLPIIMCDIERLESGSVFTYGYDYTISGIQAANMVNRILNGENIANIPFERYKRVSMGVNLKAAEKCGVIVPDDIINSATLIVNKDGSIIDKTPKLKSKIRTALFLFNDSKSALEVSKGVNDFFKEKNVLKKKNMTLDVFNAQNEFHLANSVAQKIVSNNYDYIITLSTPSLQVMANNNKKIPHVFGFVSDPYRMGIAKDSMNHIENITGVQTLQPVESSIKTIREILPKAKTIGIVWNPAEACSEACTEIARKACELYGFKLVEVNVTNTSEVQEAVNSLISKKIDVFLTSGDNTVVMAVPMIAKMLKEHKIPFVTNAFSDVEVGAFLSVGADYYEVGRETAKYALKVINGSRTKDLKIYKFVPEKMYLNLKLAEEYGIKIDQKIINKAAKVLR